MGHLDEAIRAHLELKRKHGASDEELKAEEQEALGPVRREQVVEPDEAAAELDVGEEVETPDAFEAAETFEAPPAPAPIAYDEPLEDLPPEAFHEPVDPLLEPGFGELVEPAGEATEADDLSADGSTDYTEPLEHGADEPRGPAASEPLEPPHGPLDPASHEPLEEPGAPEPAPRGAGDTPPQGLDAVEEEGEDVLEETPDFLQETPEHDRLWFEQKPPRDFDFDE